MRKLLCLLCLCLLLPGWAAADFGRSYADFEALYAENIVFLNQNTDRHMLPYTPAREYDAEGQGLYRIHVEALDAEIRLDSLGERIASCRVTLTAPEGMTYGGPQHQDFVVSGLHNYALVMAMSDAETPYERYALVDSVSQGIRDAQRFETNTGDYHVTCTREGSAVTILFENELLMDADPAAPEDDGDEEGDSLAG